jgi:hypothetical protein
MMKNLSALKKGFASLQNEINKIVISPDQWIREFDAEPSQRLGLVALLTAESATGTSLRNDPTVDSRLLRMIESGSEQEAFAAAVTYLGREAPQVEPAIRRRFSVTQNEKLKAILVGVAASQSIEETREWLSEVVLPQATDDMRTMIQTWSHTAIT